MPEKMLALGSLLLMLLQPLQALAGEPITLHASGDVAVHGTLTRAAARNDKILLLFHQARGNRHEYDPLIATFTGQGYDTLAIDQRSGGDLFHGHNETVKEQGHSADYIDALPDLKASLNWARRHDYATIVAVGSSYSSSLAILLAGAHPAGLTAVASFSPGEYFDDKNAVKNAAAKIAIPFYVTTDPGEERNVDEVLAQSQGDNIVRYKPAIGVHGASTLVQARDPRGYKKNLQSFVGFLFALSHDASQ